MMGIGSNGSPRVAVLGAPTEDGGSLCKALAEFGVSGGRVNLYGAMGDEVVLSEYAGEARMVQAPDVEEIAGHDIVFVCEPGQVVSEVLAAAGSDTVVIDMLDCLESEDRPPRVHMGVNPEVVTRHDGRCFAVPHSLTLVLAELLFPLERELGLEEVVAMVIRPAADFGHAGVEELREQTVRLLSFAEVPVSTFGRQLAFNIFPHGRPSPDRPDLEPRVQGELAELLGWNANRLTLRLITAPLFYGHCLQLRFRPAREAGLEAIRGVFESAGLLRGDPDEAPSTPLEVAGEISLELSDISDDGLGGFWLWAVAGETGSRGAQQAVRLAAEVGGL